MELADVKQFLKVDFDGDDAVISLMMEAAKEYLIDAVGSYDATRARMRLLLCMLVSDLYERRSFTVDKNSEKVSYAVHTMILQLQLEEVKP